MRYPKTLIKDQLGAWLVSTVQLSEDLFETVATDRRGVWMVYGKRYTFSRTEALGAHKRLESEIRRDYHPTREWRVYPR